MLGAGNVCFILEAVQEFESWWPARGAKKCVSLAAFLGPIGKRIRREPPGKSLAGRFLGQRKRAVNPPSTIKEWPVSKLNRPGHGGFAPVKDVDCIKTQVAFYTKCNTERT